MTQILHPFDPFAISHVPFNTFNLSKQGYFCSILGGMWPSDDPQEDLAKFG
jgi:hypothetical protein